MQKETCKILPRSAFLMNCDYFHLYLQFLEVIQNVSLPGPTNISFFSDREREKCSVVAMQNV